MREVTRTDYTEDELKNLKNGNCWCGKPRAEFDKGMRVYCCKKHREDWYERTTTWSNFRDIYLKHTGKICNDCGKDQKKLDASYDQRVAEWKKEVLSLTKAEELLKQERIDQLKRVEDMYEKAMNDKELFNSVFGYRSPDGIPQKPRESYYSSHDFEVDHIKAVALDGEMWDEKNLQVLCVDCHKKKTNADMKILKAKRRKLKRFDDE